MELSIRHFKGIARADLEISPKITLIAGKNHQGKTSILEALAATLTGSGKPPSMTLPQCATLVKSGESKAWARLQNASGSREIHWPNPSKPITEGLPPFASETAVGELDYMRIEVKKRSEFLQSVVKAEPTRGDLEAELKDHDIHVDRIKKIADEVFGNDTLPGRGFEPAYESAKTLGASLKAQWQQITGQPKWGDTIGREFAPPDWSNAFAELPIENLVEELAECKRRHEQAVADNAIGNHETEKLRELAGKEEQFLKDVQGWRERLPEAEATWKQLDQELKEMPGAGLFEIIYECTECSTKHVIAKDKLVKYDGKQPSKQEYEERKKALEAKRMKVSTARQVFDNASLGIKMSIGEHQKAKEAREKLAQLQDAPEVDPVAVENARADMAIAQSRLDSRRIKAQADEKDQHIRKNQAIIDALAPTGLRDRKMKKALDAFNATLEKLCKSAKCGRVQIAPTLSAEMDGKHYNHLASGSERYFIDAVIRVAIAQLDGSQMILFDEAQTLVDDDLKGLFRLGLAAGIPTVVAMSVASPGDMPPIAMKNLGNECWIENGEVSK